MPRTPLTPPAVWWSSSQSELDGYRKLREDYRLRMNDLQKATVDAAVVVRVLRAERLERIRPSSYVCDADDPRAWAVDVGADGFEVEFFGRDGEVVDTFEVPDELLISPNQWIDKYKAETDRLVAEKEAFEAANAVERENAKAAREAVATAAIVREYLDYVIECEAENLDAHSPEMWAAMGRPKGPLG